MTDFWTKRRAAVEAEAESAEAEAQVVEVETAAAEKTDEEVLEELGLPDPDVMEAGDDFTGFMKGAVPERLKQRALRRLWRLNPVLANVDGLVDYGEDFTDAATVIEGMQTTYQVGKGMLEHVKELARKAEEAEKALTADADGAAASDGDDAGETPASADGGVETDAEVIEAAPSLTAHEDQPVEVADDAPVAPVPDHEDIALHAPSRRMQFHFEERSTI